MFIEKIRDADKCVGCCNCKNICPVNAILMVSDKEGFLIPDVNHDLCVKCMKCETVCPNEQLKYKSISELPEVQLVKAKDEDILKKTSSGGICTLLAECFINEKKGFVCGAIYDENYNVVHIVTNKLSDIDKMRQSKYVQSSLGSCFLEIESILEKGEYVLFIGTGCQVYALKKFLNKNYNTLYCIDLICHGVPSPKVQQEYIKYLRNKNGDIECINNRHKKLYAHSYVSTYLVNYKNGKKEINRYSDDPMADAFFSHLSIRSACFDCDFKTLHRISDITIGDFWFSEKYGFGEDLLGINLCLIQSTAGEDLLRFIENKTIRKTIDANEAIVLNGGMLYNSCLMNINRKNFFEELGTIPFDKLVFKYDEKTRVTRIKNVIRECIAPVLRYTKYYNRQLEKSAKRRMNRTIPENKKGLAYYEK